MNKNIAVAGTGYVGLSISVLLAQHNHVTAVDIIPENQKHFTIIFIQAESLFPAINIHRKQHISLQSFFRREL